MNTKKRLSIRSFPSLKKIPKQKKLVRKAHWIFLLLEKQNCVCFFRCLGLSHLCEFIEDCEHTSLSTRILHLLGREGPRTTTPAKYIRYIYNRVILENAPVRAGEIGCVVDRFREDCFF